MNDLAREVWIKAALAGKRQVKRVWHSIEGNCLLGELHESLHRSQEEAKECEHEGYHRECCETLHKRFDLSNDDITKIIEASDELGYDWLTAARKL